MWRPIPYVSCFLGFIIFYKIIQSKLSRLAPGGFLVGVSNIFLSKYWSSCLNSDCNQSSQYTSSQRIRWVRKFCFLIASSLNRIWLDCRFRKGIFRTIRDYFKCPIDIDQVYWFGHDTTVECLTEDSSQSCWRLLFEYLCLVWFFTYILNLIPNLVNSINL